MQKSARPTGYDIYQKGANQNSSFCYFIVWATGFIEFFRVWQSNRDRIVGFVGREILKKDDQWTYNYNNMKEFHILTTTALFHHKYYSYVSQNKKYRNFVALNIVTKLPINGL